MTGISVTFAKTITPALSAPERHRIDAALSRIAIGAPPGRWQERPSGIVVANVLTDGRSGARVLRLEVQRGTQRLYHIAKVSSLTDARAEWRAFYNIVGRTKTVLCPPIEAVTEGVLHDRSALPGEDEAIVYTDVEQFAGAVTSNLEDLVAAAISGEVGATDTAVTVISRLFHLAGPVFYDRCSTESAPRLRREVNPSLGPDLRIATEHGAISGLPPGDGPAPRVPGRPLVPGDILAAALDLPDAEEAHGEADGPPAGSPPDGLRAGSLAAVSGLTLRRDDDRLIGEREYVTVELVPGSASADLTALPRSAEAVYVYGTVTGLRSALTWERIRRALPGMRVVTPGVVELGQTQTAHPFAALRCLLLEPVSGLVTSYVHGDLNARNVLIADGRPYLIDYARAGAGRSILGDFAWLEINLLRQPLSAALSFAELVQVGRLLALGDRVASLLPDDRHAEVIGALIAGCQPHVAAAIRMLAAIRRHARLSYAQAYAQAERSAGKSGEPWWREYAAQLILAAHRTFKWSGDLQTEATWRSAVATAAAASEQLASPDNPWRLWGRPSLARAIAAVLPLLPGEAAALPVLASLLTGLGPDGDPALEDLIQRTRARIVTATLNVTAEDMVDLHNRHDFYIDLQMDPGGGSSQPRLSALSQAIEAAQAIVLGRSGAGKTTLLDELKYRLADGPSGRFPVRLRASDVAAKAASDQTCLDPLAGRIPVRAPEGVPPSALLLAGTVHLMVDDLDEVSPDGRAAVATWLRAIRRRFPLTRVTVCHRGTDVPAELGDWTGIPLGAVTDEQIAGYLARLHAARRVSSGLIAAVLDGPDGPRLRELARTPLLLWLLASTSQKPKPPVTAGDLVGAHIGELESRPAVSGQWFSLAEALAEWQTESGETATLGEAFLAAADPDAQIAGADAGRADGDTVHGWDRAREQLINLGILVGDGPATRFRLRIYQDYFAARRLKAIAGTRPDQLSALLLRFRWRDSFALFCSFSSTGTELLRQLTDAVIDADPCYAARLLRSAAPPPADLARSFAVTQERCLLDPAAGEVARARAALALAELASPGALFRLLGVLSGAAEDPSAAELSLTALARAVLEIPPDGQRRLTIDLGLEFSRLLNEAAPPLLIAILRAIGDLELRGLELLVAERLRRPGPWPVVKEAQAALGKLGVLLPADLEDAWRRAQQSRLIEVERELFTVTSAAEANRLQNERFLLLDENHGAGRVASLLERRFTFEIGALLGELIDEAARPGGADRPRGIANDPDDILSGPDADPDELLAAVGGPGQLTAAAAAHRLLRDRPDLSGRMFRMLALNGRTDRPLIAAAAAARLPVAELPAVVDYFRRLLESGDEGSAEALAVLAQAISWRDPLAAVRLTRQAHRFLADHNRADRLRWPWAAALARFGGTAAQLDTLLSTDTAADQRLAIEALASAGFLLTAGPAPAHRFSDTARQRLLDACRGARGDETVVLLRAAAAMSLPEALDVLFAAGTLADTVAALDPYSPAALTVPGYGLIEVAPAADALAAIGYLGRLIADTDSTTAIAGGAAEAAHRLLRGFDLPGTHPSVPVGRLIGLGYLGDWQPVLDALGADQRMPAIARHTLELWVPGPYPPDGYARQASVARWIVGRLAEPGLTPDIRSVLLDLKRSAEERAGLLVPGPDQAG
jgi:hypothetical protein